MDEPSDHKERRSFAEEEYARLTAVSYVEEEDPPAPEPVKRPLRWSRFALLGFTALLPTLFLIYLTGIFLGHSVPGKLPENLPSQVWADPKIGTAIELVETQVSDYGWATSEPAWHPKSRLIALPAFQSGLADTLIAFISLRANLISSGGQPDRDLVLAASLIDHTADDQTESRLFAAVEALRRFDGLKARYVLSDLSISEILSHELSLFEQIVSTDIEALRTLEASGKRGLYDTDRTRTYFRKKGHLYAIALLIRANKPEDILQPGYRGSLTALQTALDRAVAPSPFLTSNPSPDGFSLGGNDIAILADLMTESRSKLIALSEVLTSETPEAETVSLSKS